MVRASQSGDPVIHLVAALQAEAGPVIEALELRPVAKVGARSPFPVFETDGVTLVVSGLGKVAAAAATATLAAQSEDPGGGWLNFGIAGHSRRPLGSAMVAYEIRDRANGARFYPPQLFDLALPGGTVVTVDQVERRMDLDVAYEMEASGFVATARRFASAELVQAVKVVSDGPSTDLETLTVQRVQDLISGQLDGIIAMIDGLRGLVSETIVWPINPDDVEFCLKRWHFTVSDELTLRRQLRRRQVLAPSVSLPLDGISANARGRDINRRLCTWLDEMPLDLRREVGEKSTDE